MARTAILPVGRWAHRHHPSFLPTVVTWMERHRSRRRLLSLDDYMLRDIGLSHADVYQESRKPFWRA